MSLVAFGQAGHNAVKSIRCLIFLAFAFAQCEWTQVIYPYFSDFVHISLVLYFSLDGISA